MMRFLNEHSSNNLISNLNASKTGSKKNIQAALAAALLVACTAVTTTTNTEINKGDLNVSAFAGACQAVEEQPSAVAGVCAANNYNFDAMTVANNTVSVTGVSMDETTEEAVEETAEEIVEETEEVEESGFNEDGTLKISPDEDVLSYNVPNEAEDCKSYNFTHMSYKKITCKKSLQYPVVNSELAYTDPETNIRMYNGEILVAIGTGYGYIPGDNILIVFEDGSALPAVVGEMKADCDTDPTNRYQATDGSVVEILIDGKSYIKPEIFNQKVISIEKIEG